MGFWGRRKERLAPLVLTTAPCRVNGTVCCSWQGACSGTNPTRRSRIRRFPYPLIQKHACIFFGYLPYITSGIRADKGGLSPVIPPITCDKGYPCVQTQGSTKRRAPAGLIGGGCFVFQGLHCQVVGIPQRASMRCRKSAYSGVLLSFRRRRRKNSLVVGV
ncbi:hypothetical protein STH332 [Symbiobacterium thermophilum IAM 14863]|uniref:Uncharacterized protein n=1 Tax=Symbiobacterium thermophilum (strain DSM 24528 / JCM 14929 / IAM 14863 / T) TaxID=292459 RepID=Q67SM6_SYMTH|nr:hypothetical protein STH332 [Symbiobacterium thermophilum IAM 14863]